MADSDRNIIEIIVQGAQHAVQQISSVAASQASLAAAQERATQQQVALYQRVADAAQRAAQAQVDAAGRARDAQTGRFISGEEVQRRTIAAQTQALSSNLGNPQRLQVAIDAAAFTAARNAIVAQQAAAQTLQGRLQSLGSTAVGLARQLGQLVTGHNAAAQAATNQANATAQAGTRGITYLSVLSAIHAASFLATNQTFSMIGSFVTLGAAFGKMGLAAAGVGLAFGAVLGLIGQVSAAIQQIQKVAIQGAVGFATLAAGITAGAVAAGTAAVQLASGVETQVASVRAFGNATAAQLAEVRQQAIGFSEQFGVAAKDVLEATSLFSRAGGSVEEAIQGATEAILRLQVASQGELTAAQAAIAVSAALKQFSLDGSQAIRVADNLTAAAQGSALSFASVQQAFIQAAPGAAALGITIEDLSASIALLGDQLIKGTTTGTAFKQFILDVVNPTKQAQTELAKYGISLRDSNGNALPFLDALQELNKGLGDNAVEAGLVTKEQRATALAIAFGSRAFLAANILTREGTEGLQRYREELAQTSTSNIVDVLLLPLNKQLERLRVVAENTGEAFGGPLLGPLRQTVATAIGVLQSIRPAAEVAGQAVGVILTGQGFGALQHAIDRVVGNNALSSFFIELVNSARNVRDVIVSQIIPAIQQFASDVAGIASDRVDDTAAAFANVNRVIQGVGASAAAAITGLGTLIGEFVRAEGTGGRLRETVENLARAILTNLAASLSVALITLQAAIVAMPIFARVALLAAQAALQLAGALKEVALKSVDVIEAGARLEAGRQGFTKLFDPEGAKEVKQEIAEIVRQSELWRKQIAGDADAAQKLAGDIQKMLPELDKLAAGFANTGQASAENARIARSSISEIVDEIVRAEGINVELLSEDDVARLIARAGAMKQGAIGATNPILQVFEDLSGRVGTALDNVIATTEQKRRELEESASGTRPGVPGALSDEELKRAGARIEEAGRDVNRRLANLGKDAATRVRQNIERALERLDDIRQNALDRVDEISRQAQDRITEGQRTSRERREDRDEIDAEKRKQEDLFTAFQRGLDKQETAEQRALDDIRTLRSQATDDFVRDLDHQVQDVEKAEQRKLDLVQRGFDLAQRARELAFDRAQSAEATAFARTQEAQAAARQFQLDLSRAKTPEERARVQEQRQQAIQDTQFRRGQEDQLTQFRLRQEEQKRKFSDAAETQAISFRQGLEERLTAFRRASETSVIKRRRELEVIETGIRRGEEDETTRRRLANEDKVAERRLSDALKLQRLQDAIEDKRRGEEEVRILGNAFNESQKVIANAEKQAGEVIDKLFLDLNQQADDVNKQIRNIGDTLVDLGDQVPPELLGAFLAQLEQARARGEALKGTLAGLQEDARLQVSQRAATNQAELELKLAALLPSPARAIPQPAGTPAPIVQLQTLQAANVILPPGFSGAVAGAVRLGIQQAVEQGLLPREVGVDLTPVVNPLEAIQRLFGR